MMYSAAARMIRFAKTFEVVVFLLLVFPEWRDIGVHWCLHCLQVYLYDLSVYRKD